MNGYPGYNGAWGSLTESGNTNSSVIVECPRDCHLMEKPLEKSAETASVILAAGRGSRMEGFEGNKTLLPLVSGDSPHKGSRPILLQILSSLPSGPKAVVVNYKKEDVMEATRGLDLTYCQQPKLNGTGGALLAARPFLESQDCNELIITMGDVPLVKKSTYKTLLKSLKDNSFVVLGFCPESRKQYGVLEIQGDQVKRIIEWKYWKTYPEKRQQDFRICNSGIYAARKADLLRYLLVLASRPHKVQKEIDGRMCEVEEFFITDLVKYMRDGGLPVGYVIAEDEEEVIGVDDLSALKIAQEIFLAKYC
jgi:bifunctional UDP-N-acetylglucosamine pyrophosphorylase/glucosamine-1-phosphate N-acetyltransferase